MRWSSRCASLKPMILQRNRRPTGRMDSDIEQTPEEERTRFAVTHEAGKVLLDIQGPLGAGSHTLTCAETLNLVYELVHALSGASMATDDTPQGR